MGFDARRVVDLYDNWKHWFRDDRYFLPKRAYILRIDWFFKHVLNKQFDLRISMYIIYITTTNITMATAYPITLQYVYVTCVEPEGTCSYSSTDDEQKIIIIIKLWTITE